MDAEPVPTRGVGAKGCNRRHIVDYQAFRVQQGCNILPLTRFDGFFGFPSFAEPTDGWPWQGVTAA
jgi:hypothetical protein